jgi:Ca2+-binding RTX toxin-like protein
LKRSLSIVVLAAATLAVVMPIEAGAAKKVVPSCKGKKATLVAVPGDGWHWTFGTPGNDVIVADPGGSNIDGQGGDDLICGSSYADTIQGGAGHDRIYAGGGNDWIKGSVDSDFIDGGAGKDRCGVKADTRKHCEKLG